jgi:hypothetical protein
MGIEIIVTIATVGFWLFAEFRLSRPWRLGSGIVAVTVTGLACYYAAGFVPELESFRHRRAMKQIAESLSVGDTNRVEQAVGMYNAVVLTGSTYEASGAMLQVLSRGEKSP